jgi:CO/xanthine dehydrogenase Mo-binding subunit
MAGAAYVIEGEYRTAAQEQLYLETQGMIAEADGESVTVWGSMQCPYYVLGALERTMGVRPRVVQMETGGGFGGKEEYPSAVATYAALLARKSGRPVKMIYDRAEDMAATTKRHPSVVWHRTGVGADGRLVAMEIDVELDGGAYTTLSPVVLSRGCIHAAGAYYCPNVRIAGRVVRSNHVPFGAFRGFGAPQTIFAMERQMEKIAAAAELDAIEVRRRNFIRQGQETVTGQVLREPVLLEQLLERAVAESGYREKRAAGRRGLGIAAAVHGIGFTGSGEKYLRSQVKLERTRVGGARILVSSAEFGQGALTVLPQIVAEELGVGMELVEMTHPDTGTAPDSGPTVASRTTMIVGDLLRRAARRMRESGAESVTERYAPPEGFAYDDATNRGDAYETYSWAVNVAEVEVDRETGEARLTDFVAVQDAGRIVNPVLAEGQVAGGAAQGIGLALCEEVVYREGRVANGSLANYVIPTTADLPPLRVYFEGQEGRVKGLGELPVSGAGPAVANAIADQLGIEADRLPVTAERILACLR